MLLSHVDDEYCEKQYICRLNLKLITTLSLHAIPQTDFCTVGVGLEPVFPELGDQHLEHYKFT